MKSFNKNVNSWAQSSTEYDEPWFSHLIVLFIARRLVNTLIESVNLLNILIKQAPTVTKGIT